MCDTDQTRIVGDPSAIDYESTSSFFKLRGLKASGDPLTATMYQDLDLAQQRDREEKETILPLLKPKSDDIVLDMGCGSGRWADAMGSIVGSYLGLDFSAPLLNSARERFPRLTFQVMDLAAFDAEKLLITDPFTLVICSGILAYINDQDVESLFHELSSITEKPSRIYVREPMAKHTRLTLNRYWSEELKTYYSAIYRTRSEYMTLFDSLDGFRVCTEGEPFSHELQNRAETEQRYVLLERRA